MKIRTYISLLTLLSLSMMSCTSSLQVSNSSSWNDEIYGSTPKPQIKQIAQKTESSSQTLEKSDSNLDQLEQKFSGILDINMDSIKNDTVIYRAEETNPYNKILSNSYEESYERRLRGLEDPWYGMNNWSAYYSDDYWYAQAYDPYFYRIVVMGNQVWVEPWYISAMFAWPRTKFSVGFGWGWYYSYCDYTYPGYYYSWTYWNNLFLASKEKNYYPNDYYYGRRFINSTQNTISRRSSNEIANLSTHQTAITRRSDARTTSTSNAISTTRTTQTRVTPTYSNTSSTRVSGSLSNRPTRSIGISEPTRRSYNSSYDRSRTTTNNNTNIDSRINSTRGSYPTRGSSNSTSIYNNPGRVSSPSATSSSRSSGGSAGRSSSGSSSSGSIGRSSSGSSGSSSSGSIGRSSSGSSSSTHSTSSSSSSSGSKRR
ncbi:MAG: hypothetical protein AB7S48_12915 [Bacteroidales bacterium]